MSVVERVRIIKPFYVMEFLEMAKAMEKEGIDIIHMEVGEPDFNAPEEVKEKAFEALRKNFSHYTESLGMEELRGMISEYYRRREGVEIPIDRIVITNGTSGAFLLLFLCLLDRKKSLLFPTRVTPVIRISESYVIPIYVRFLWIRKPDIR
jgi:aspartate/methionine/tyrosine aminotransferase